MGSEQSFASGLEDESSSPFRVLDLGVLGYRKAWDEQLRIFQEVASGGPDTLILVEHPPVMTLGANFHESNLLLPIAEYEGKGIEVHRTDRGGDVTYHGPGQIVAYPIFDLNRHGRDLHLWLRTIEQTVMNVCAEYGLESRRFPPHTGVWLGDKKVCAIGIKVKRWISLHGLALNCTNDLRSFNLIVPCGIQGYGVTSLSTATGRSVTVEEVKPRLTRQFQQLFEEER
ncbi:MAG: lipoyl(octanoyl) transferase LipB [Fimbriimonadaceae bacterium]|nr:lipoyl(octanoyl) transferase LipB [Fimbriimonadaceae bacterium]